MKELSIVAWAAAVGALMYFICTLEKRWQKKLEAEKVSEEKRKAENTRFVFPPNTDPEFIKKSEPFEPSEYTEAEEEMKKMEQDYDRMFPGPNDPPKLI